MTRYERINTVTTVSTSARERLRLWFPYPATIMTVFGAVLLHFFLLFQTTAAAEEQEQPVVMIRERGTTVLLPCFGILANETLLVTRWKKSGQIVVTHESSQSPSTGHLSVQNDGSLKITNLMFLDEALYECNPVPRDNSSSRTILLQVADGPNNETIKIEPSTALSSETRYVQKGTNVSFNCSSESYPSQNLKLFIGNLSRAYGIAPSLEFKISNIQPADQGNYTCRAQNLLSNKTVTWSQNLLVYYAPERHPNCSWKQTIHPDLILFSCSWHGGYPTPNLQVFLTSETVKEHTIVGSNVTENLVVALNRTMLYDGQNVTCVGRYSELQPAHEKSCSFILKFPYPTGAPLVATLEGNNVTLSCSEYASLPPAKTVWQRGTNQEVITPSSKYILTTQGPVLTLTIVNVTKDDEGVYFCYSENVLAVRELEVYLTVRSFDSSGAVVGVFISILIVVAGVTLGFLAYSRRDRICLSFGFRGLEEDRTDVMSLVESDEDDVFHSAVPRLPPISNGHGPTNTTTLVEIHRIQSSDHEDNVNDTEQADQEQVTAEE